jgi:hypothetical protein
MSRRPRSSNAVFVQLAPAGPPADRAKGTTDRWLAGERAGVVGLLKRKMVQGSPPAVQHQVSGRRRAA